jgi:hypothetical protein
MKNLTVILSVLLLSMNTDVNCCKTQDYIHIRFTGPQQLSANEIIIVKNEVDFETIENRLKFDGMQGAMTRKKAEDERVWNLFFNTVITDQRTFSEVKAVIDKNPVFFSDKDSSQFSIVVNGSVHLLTLNSQEDFFNKLYRHLKKEKCDSNVISAIVYYHDAVGFRKIMR